MRASAGFSLLEMMIAVFILGVGVIAAASLQGSALSSSGKARATQEATNAARTEIELQRQVKRPGTQPAQASPPCQSTPPSGYTCTISVAPCRIAGTPPALSCGSVTSAQIVAADQITVRISRARASTVELNTVVAR